MTREEALHILDTIPTIGEQVDALELAIKALEQQPCEDCISRKDLIEYANNLKDGIGITANDIARFPSIQPKPKTGHWIIKEGREQGYDIAGIKTWYIQIMCDKCGFIKTAIEGHTGQYHFCPNCGAKMESEDKE